MGGQADGARAATVLQALGAVRGFVVLPGGLRLLRKAGSVALRLR